MYLYALANGDVLCAWHTTMHLLERNLVQIDVPEGMNPERVIMDASTHASIDLTTPRNPWGVRVIDVNLLPVIPSCTRCSTSR